MSDLTPVTALTVPETTPGATSPAAPARSGATHQSSGPSGPDPTGLRGSLEKAVAEAEAKKAKPGAQAATGAGTSITAATRDPTTGKFATGGEPATAKPEVTADAAGLKPTEPIATMEDAPASWRTEAKALWSEIDAKFSPEQAKLLKGELWKRENDFKNGIIAKDTELKGIKPFHDEVQNLIKPYAENWKAQGVQPQQALSHLLNLGENFRKNPAQTILWLAQAGRINLADLVQKPADGSQQGGTTDPQLSTALQEINGLKNQLYALQNGMAQSSTNSAAAEIQAFMDEKGQDGQPLRPHFGDVFSKVQLLMPAIKSEHPGWTPRQVVTEAYDTAIYAHPEVRQKVLGAITASEKTSQEAAARQRAAELAAQSATKGGPPNKLNGAADTTNLRGLLESKMNGQARL